MSGATAKAIRRDLRRAAGEDAVEALENCIKVIDNRILPNIEALQKIADDHEGRIGALQEQLDSECNTRHHNGKVILGVIDAFKGMSLRQRLRWLIMGR